MKKRIRKTMKEIRNYEYVVGAERIIGILEDLWGDHTPLRDMLRQTFSPESKILWEALERAREAIKPKDKIWRDEFTKRLEAYEERDRPGS